MLEGTMKDMKLVFFFYYGLTFTKDFFFFRINDGSNITPTYSRYKKCEYL